MKQLYQLEVYCYLILTDNNWITLYTNKEQAAGFKGLKTLQKLFDENFKEVRKLMIKDYKNQKEKHYRIMLTTLEIEEDTGLLISQKILKGMRK